MHEKIAEAIQSSIFQITADPSSLSLEMMQQQLDQLKSLIENLTLATQAHPSLSPNFYNFLTQASHFQQNQEELKEEVSEEETLPPESFIEEEGDDHLTRYTLKGTSSEEENYEELVESMDSNDEYDNPSPVRLQSNNNGCISIKDLINPIGPYNKPSKEEQKQKNEDDEIASQWEFFIK